MTQERLRSPDKEQIDGLFREFRHSGDTELRDQIISRHLYLVQAVARKFSELGESYDDLVQEGAMGLISAVDMYDLERGVQFATYATHLIEGHIRHYLRDKAMLIRQPAWVQELTSKISKTADTLAQELERTPTPSEIAKHLKISETSVVQVIKARQATRVSSLDAPKSEDQQGAGGGRDLDKLLSERATMMNLSPEDRIFLQEAIDRLKALERKVLYLFYYMDLNQTEIARRLGISVNYASYLLRGALGKLREIFRNQAAQVALLEQPPPQAASPYSPSWRSAPIDKESPATAPGQFLDRVRQEFQRAQRYPQSFALVLLELDLPAETTGDERQALLENAGNLIRRNVRSIDLVARLEGSRFGLLLPHTGRQASVLGERLCTRLKGLAPAKSGEPPLVVNIGLAVYPSDARSEDDLMRVARRGVEAARNGGGNQVCRVKPAPAKATASAS